MREQCVAQLKDGRAQDLMLMLGLNEAMHQLTMIISVRLYGHMLRKWDGHVLKMTSDIKVEAQRRKWNLMEKNWKNYVNCKSVDVGLSKEDFLFQSQFVLSAKDCHYVEMNPSTLCFLGYYWIYGIGLFL